MAHRELDFRLVVAAVGIPAVLTMVVLGGWVLGIAAALAAGIGTHELFQMAKARGEEPFSAVGILASVTVVLLATAYPTPTAVAPLAAGVLLLVVVVATGASAWLRWPERGPSSAVGVTALGVVLVGFTMGFVPILRALPSTVAPPLDVGRAAAAAFVLLPVLSAWAGDSAAFFAGRAWGKPKLAPHVSPGKTRVGALFGLMGSGGAAAVVSWWGPSHFPALTLPVAVALGFGVMLGAAGQVGDLAVSVLKREAGVKDSGVVFPGHGGMLDRLDALLFTFPLTWALLRLLGMIPAEAQ